MKIIFVNPNQHSDYPKPPLGLLSLATVCRKAGYDASILDANLLNLHPLQVARELRDADVVGLSAMTPTYDEACAIARVIDKEIPIVLGGVHASIFPKEALASDLFDWIVTGEGEAALLGLLQGKTYPSRIVNEPVDMTKLPLPDYSLLGTYKPRYPHGISEPWTAASSSRGCPMKCRFCAKAVFGDRFRAFTCQQTCDLMAKLDLDGYKDVTFYDDEFTWDKQRVYAICDRLRKAHLSLTWTCESRVDLVNPELLSEMKSAGCRLIYYGIESGNQDILNRLDKRITLERVKEAVKETQDVGIEAAGYFMLGCPGETKETMQQTIDFAQSLQLDHAQFSACTPLPGSLLYEEYIKTHDRPKWSDFRYRSNGTKVLFTSDRLSASDIEQAVERGNTMFRENK